MELVALREVDSPIGKIELGATGAGLTLCATGIGVHQLQGELEKRGALRIGGSSSPAASGVLDAGERSLELYFSGELAALLSLPLCPLGTPFQSSVWQALSAIRAGELATYKEVAESINNPSAVRAVGTACSQNLLHLFIPCHRVVSVDGALSGFRGGVEIKRWLLNFERETCQEEEILEQKQC